MLPSVTVDVVLVNLQQKNNFGSCLVVKLNTDT